MRMTTPVVTKAVATVPGVSNALFFGDCIELPDKTDCHFDLIYLDPPFNVGKNFHTRGGVQAYKDRWGGLEGFLDMLTLRLRVLFFRLRPAGSMWIHIDQRTSHYVKVEMDKMGAHYQGEVIYDPGNGSKSHGLPRTHQTILVYSHTEAMTWNVDDPSLRVPFAEGSMQTHFRNVDVDGRRYRERVVNGKSYKYYADAGKALGSVWADISGMAGTSPVLAESTGYPTQKPLALLERIICGATMVDGLVCDPMFGSGTTLVAAHKLGRKFVGSDMSLEAVQLATQRLSSLGISYQWLGV